MCYQSEANSILLCDKHSTNSRMLSINCRYFKGNSHMIHLNVHVHDSFNSLGTGLIRCLGECQTIYERTTPNIHIAFTCRICVLFAFRCKPSLKIHFLWRLRHNTTPRIQFQNIYLVLPC